MEHPLPASNWALGRIYMAGELKRNSEPRKVTVVEVISGDMRGLVHFRKLLRAFPTVFLDSNGKPVNPDAESVDIRSMTQETLYFGTNALGNIITGDALKATLPHPLEINPQEVYGHWIEGWALDLHTLSSMPIKDEDGNIKDWDTKRPPIAEELYRLKYWRERNRITIIARTAADFLSRYISQWKLDLIIPIPPSDTARAFQPVYEMAIAIGALTILPVDTSTLKKVKSTSELKEIEDPDKRREILKDAFTIDTNALSGKNVLIFDDLYRSGETLNAACDVLIKKGKVRSVYALTVTKTRSKR